MPATLRAEILGHEPVHRFRQMNTPEYHTFVDFAVQMEEQLERRIANGEGYGMMFEYIRGQYEGAGLQMNAAKNVDEIAARFAQRLFGNERDAMMVIKEMNAHPETRTALQKFMELVQELIWKLQRAWRRLRNQGEYAAAKELGMTIKQLEQARKLWVEAYKATADAVEQRREERESGGAKAEKNTTAVGDVSYSLSSTKRARLEKTILDLSNANIKKIAGEKVIRISTDQYSVNKAIYSKKGRSDREVNARIKSIPEFEDIIRRSVFSHTDTDIIGIDADAKKGVIAMHYFKTSHNGFDIEVLVRDKGKKQFLYEIKFIENKKNSQQSMSNNFDSSAPNGDVENKINIPQSPESVKSEFSLKDDIDVQLSMMGDTFLKK